MGSFRGSRVQVEGHRSRVRKSRSKVKKVNVNGGKKSRLRVKRAVQGCKIKVGEPFQQVDLSYKTCPSVTG